MQVGDRVAQLPNSGKKGNKPCWQSPGISKKPEAGPEHYCNRHKNCYLITPAMISTMHIVHISSLMISATL